MDDFWEDGRPRSHHCTGGTGAPGAGRRCFLLLPKNFGRFFAQNLDDFSVVFGTLLPNERFFFSTWQTPAPEFAIYFFGLADTCSRICEKNYTVCLFAFFTAPEFTKIPPHQIFHCYRKSDFNPPPNFPLLPKKRIFFFRFLFSIAPEKSVYFNCHWPKF